MTQAHIFYSGTVQGIGFRFTVQRFAKELDLTGWVKNLKDGRVEILVEGKKEPIEELVKNLNRYFEGYIQDHSETYAPSEGNFKDFQIAY